ncbi:MAG: zinc-dependent peptidase [Saprospiraceae bacterium]|nr:zinc-dependent peptidase [Saprospiraceae bacterium]
MHLSQRKKRENQILSIFFSTIIAVIFLAVVWSVKDQNLTTFAILVAIATLASYRIYYTFTHKYREREELVDIPFPDHWRDILQDHVAFYRALSEEEKRKFETEIQIFLHETRVTGVKCEVDDVTLLLAAASAEIPVFGFPDWEYPNLGEILIYPNAFTKDFQTEGEGRNVWGMVGTGIMEGIMILSKPALINGFKNPNDKLNVGIHEFAHLLDGADGKFDGIPSLFLENRYLEPWLDTMYKEMNRIRAGQSKMNPYGATNQIEFFAVATEYFFEHPKAMQDEKPELYELLTKVFRQDTGTRFKDAVKSMFGYTGKKMGRNMPCVCGSGKKFKHCCMKNSRQY